ncbi:MAG: cell division protein FtsA [Bdellovibrionales bacterium]|nr:cell division protein FtsA [Bdellovibrionales bacterium]
MANKSNTIVGLDIGTTTITVVVGEILSDGKVNIVGVGRSPSRGLRKGVVINIEATVESISKAIEQAETMAGIEISSVIAAISGSHIKGINSNGIVGIKGKEVSSIDVEKVIDAAKAVAIPLDREVLHVLPQEFIIDDQDGIREPLGISGVRLEVRVHIVTGAVASAQNIVKCANRCGLSVRDIVLASLASGAAVISPEEQELGVCLVDIGGGTTDITVFHGGGVKHTSVLAVGGTHITNDIAAGLRTPIAAAESIKCEYASAIGSSAAHGALSHQSTLFDETIEVPSTGGRPPRVISRTVLSDIVEPRMNEIFTLVQRELMRAGCEEFLTSGIVLTGGTANLQGIEQLAENIFDLPVRVGAPIGISGVVDLVKGPEYSTAVGLALQGAKEQSLSSFSTNRSFTGKVFQRVSNWFAEHF